jgi:hypothetical protein
MNNRTLSILIFFFVFVGCNPVTTETTEPTKSNLLTKTPTVVVTPKPVITPTSSFVVMPSQTWTPLPTLSHDDGMQMLTAWFEGTDYCRLPCWAGITPGETNWEESWHLLQPLQRTVKLESGTNVDCDYGKCSFISWSRAPIERGILSSIYPENIIDYIMLETIEPDHLIALSLRNILSIYGKPAILLFSTDPDQPGQKHLELILVYPERQFLIRYSRYAEISGENIESCGQDSVIKLVILDNQEQLASVDVIAKSIETKEFYVDVWHKSVEESTGMTIDAFYDTFSKDNAPCIVTPIMLWQP